MLTTTAFREWLEGYREAFQTMDPPAAGALFGENVVYVDSPFAEPVLGRASVTEYWAQVAGLMRDIEFGFEIIAVDGDVGVARVHDALIRTSSGLRMAYDGIFVCRFDGDLRCREFREWWVQDPVGAARQTAHVTLRDAD